MIVKQLISKAHNLKNLGEKSKMSRAYIENNILKQKTKYIRENIKCGSWNR
jgi:hypothetical protein